MIEADLEALRAADTPTFDREYIAMQLGEHEAVLDQIDHKLLLHVTHPRLKAELLDTRELLVRHLQVARALAERLEAAE